MKIIKQRYQEQKNAAIQRGIEWEFTFESWWKVWEDSGQWENRGRSKGKYCMSRKEDKGPYNPENVFIQTHEQNAKDARKYNKTLPSTVWKKGITPWNKGLKGAQVAWNKGIPMSEETKQKLSKIKTTHGKYVKHT